VYIIPYTPYIVKFSGGFPGKREDYPLTTEEKRGIMVKILEVATG